MWEPKSNPRDRQGLWALYISVALISVSILMLEISVTRIFSVMFDYHYVFLLISLAILGLGVGGIYVHTRVEKIAQSSHQSILPASSGLVALTTLVATISIVRIPFLHHPLLAALLTFFPFFFGGVFISAAFRFFAGKSTQIYAFDLIGASLGAILVVVFLRLGGIDTNLFVAFLGSLPMGLIMYGQALRKSRKVISLVLIVGLFSIFLGNRYTGFLGEVPLGRGPHKEMPHLLGNPAGKARVVDSRWSAFGRTDLIADETDPDAMAFFIDGTAGTIMYRFDGEFQSLEESGLTDFSEYFPLELLSEGEKEKVLIIGSGAGVQVLISILGGAKEITAVEVNEDLVDLVKEYSDFNGGIYDGLPGVKVVVEEGRNFVRSREESYEMWN